MNDKKNPKKKNKKDKSKKDREIISPESMALINEMEEITFIFADVNRRFQFILKCIRNPDCLKNPENFA